VTHALTFDNFASQNTLCSYHTHTHPILMLRIALLAIYLLTYYYYYYYYYYLQVRVGCHHSGAPVWCLGH
jgi:hypothetical protein